MMIEMKPSGAVPANQCLETLTSEVTPRRLLLRSTEATEAKVVKRIWNRDASLWKNEPAHQKIITNSLGWLTVADEMLEATDELTSFAAEINSSGDFEHVMVCGMGGSSLCPEVLRQTFGKREGYPELLVLDSTDPDTINNFQKQIDVEQLSCLLLLRNQERLLSRLLFIVTGTAKSRKKLTRRACRL